jgi:hypothetical protein
MKKILFTAAALLTMSATGFAIGGQTGTLTWTLSDDSTLTISGEGAMPDYGGDSTAPWYSSSESITAVVIEDGVKTIGNNAFDMCRNLISVSIPNSVTSIGDWAFFGCSGLTSVTVPEGVTNIGNSCFAYCTGLTSVTVPGSVTEIGIGVFENCRKLTSFTNLNPTPQNISIVFEYVDLKKVTLYVPTESVETYKAAPVWKDFKEILPYGTDAIESPEAAGGVSIYPNPVAEIFYVDGITSPTQVTVTDLSGRTVLKHTVNGREPVAVGHLPKGVYLVNVNGNTVKVVKL